MRKKLKPYRFYLIALAAVVLMDTVLAGQLKQRAADTGSANRREQSVISGETRFFPIAGSGLEELSFDYVDSWQAARSFGGDRHHEGCDIITSVNRRGVYPVVSMTDGTVEQLGWLKLGGWRIGIRSPGGMYYYYAHLRQNYPYAEGLEEGSIVTAGDVIGYLGHTGYSTTENVNNIDIPHLHFGIQLIFDESQKEGNNEIWIDCYQITRFLSRNRSLTEKIQGTKEWKRVYDMKEPGAKAKETG